MASALHVFKHNSDDVAKLQQLLKDLGQFISATPHGFITLHIPAAEHSGDIQRVIKMLSQEEGTACCIRSRKTRLAFIKSIKAVQEKVKQYETELLRLDFSTLLKTSTVGSPNVPIHKVCSTVFARRVPKNGLVLYYGHEAREDEEHELGAEFEPPFSITQGLYRAEGKFETQTLLEMMAQSEHG